MTSCDTIIAGTSLPRVVARGLPGLDARLVDHARPGAALPRRSVAHEARRGNAAHPPSRAAASAA